MIITKHDDEIAGCRVCSGSEVFGQKDEVICYAIPVVVEEVVVVGTIGVPVASALLVGENGVCVVYAGVWE